MSIYKRGTSLYYEFQYHGQTYRKSCGPVSHATALKAEHKRRVDVAEGHHERPHPPDLPTVAAFMAEYLHWYGVHHRPNSLKLARIVLQRWCRWYGQIRLDGITARMVEGKRVAMIESGMAPNYANAHVAQFCQMLRRAVTWQMMPREHAPSVSRIRIDHTVTRIVSPEEERLLVMAATLRLKPLIRFALQTGMRHDELLQLRWLEIDWGRGVICIPGSRAKGRRDREIPLNDTAWEILEALPRHSDETRVFGYRNFSSLFVAARRAAGLPEDVKLHTLRHTFATRALQAGVDARSLQKWLGHQSLAMTEQYVHPQPDHEQRAIRLLDGPHATPHSPTGHTGRTAPEEDCVR